MRFGKRTWRFPRGVVCLGTVVLLLASGSFANAIGVVTLEWDPNPENDIAGYRLYYGTASGSYSQSVDVGNVTSATLANLVAGTTYYAAATAYNTSAIESDPSNEVTFVPKSPYQNWLAANFTPEELGNASLENSLWGTLSDPDGDRFSNLMEYAFGLDPRAPDTVGPVQSTIEIDNSVSYPAVTFERPLSAKDIRYTVQVTGTFTNWYNGSVYHGDNITASNDETTEILRIDDGIMETITVRANDPIADPNSQSCFLRVIVVIE